MNTVSVGKTKYVKLYSSHEINEKYKNNILWIVMLKIFDAEDKIFTNLVSFLEHCVLVIFLKMYTYVTGLLHLDTVRIIKSIS